jgi:ATP-dependent Zn protease
VSDRYSTAIHEAGHAVMACRLKRPIGDATIVPICGANGKVDIDFSALEDAKEWAAQVAMCLIASYGACLAGRAGMMGTYQDGERARSTLETYTDDPEAFEKCKTLAVEMMHRPENIAAVQRLAKLLLERETIDGDAVRACIAQADSDLKEGMR